MYSYNLLVLLLETLFFANFLSITEAKYVRGSVADGWSFQPNDPWVLVGEEVMFYFHPLDPRADPPALCSVSSSNRTFTADPTFPGGKDYEILSGFPDRIHISGDGSNGCIARIRNSSHISDDKWKFQIKVNSRTDKEISIVSVSIIDPPDKEMTVSVTIGSHVTINCKDLMKYTAPHYCRIYGNNGKLMSSDCSTIVDPVKPQHIGDWTCAIALFGTMRELNSTIKLIEQERESLVKNITLQQDHLVLECKLRMSSSSVTWCRVQSPHGDRMLLSPGLIHGRYSALSTRLAEKSCGMEIKLPLDPATDYGQWRMEIGKAADTYTGCFFYLPDDKEVFPSALPPGSVRHEVVEEGKTLTIGCSVPWPAAYCYALQPDGTPVQTGSIKQEGLLRIGVCSIKAANVTMKQTGMWTCGLSSNDGTKDLLFYTDVEVYNRKFQAEKGIVEAVSGQVLTLLCRSAVQRPLRYCRVTPPSGTPYSLFPNTTNYSRLSYWGAGLEFGECGVRIERASHEDVGMWMCATSFELFSSEEFATITVGSLKPSTAFTIGMSLAGVIFISIILGMLVIGYRKRQAQRLREQDRTPSLSPSSSSDAPINSTPNYALYGARNSPVCRLVRQT